MNPYFIPCHCDVCGGEGMAIRGSAWTHTFRHTDPKVCAENLKSERRKLEKLKEELNNK